MLGKIPEDICLKLLAKYTEEQTELKSEISELENALSVVSKNEAWMNLSADSNAIPTYPNLHGNCALNS